MYLNAMRSTLFLCILLLTSLAAISYQEREFSETAAFQPGEKLSIKTYKGSIHLSSWDRPEVSIFARITPPEDESASYQQAVVDATQIEVRRSGGTLRVRSDYDKVPSRGNWFSNSKNLPYVHYEIRAPRELELDVDDYKSSIELYELSGRLQVETYKGSVKASDLTGQIRLETYKGTARLSGLQGSVDVDTYKGNVSVEALRIDDSSRLNTYKGEIELAVPENQSFVLVKDIGKRGTLKSDMSGSSRRVEAERSDGRSGQDADGSGPRLSVSTHKGDIRLIHR